MIGDHFNYDDTFLRDLTICVLDTFENRIQWVNRFSHGVKQVNVPIYYSMTGDERFLLDSFSPDMASDVQPLELNTDIIPRGHVTFNGMNIKSDEFANPNQWLKMVIENDVEIKKIISKVRAIPIAVNYDLEIILKSEIDVFKCTQALMDTMWLYRFMYFEYNFMNIDAVIIQPDNSSINIVREKNMTSDNTITIKVSFEVHTYYPSMNANAIDLNPPVNPNTGMFDMNPNEIIDGDETNNNKPEYDAVYPRRTKWFNNIIKIREMNAKNQK